MPENDTQAVGTDDPVQDTSVAPASEASEALIEAPEATQEQVATEEVATPETNAEDTAEAKLYAGKYKTVEEMEDAYRNLNTKATRDAMEKAELTRILDQAFATPEAPAAQDTEAYSYEQPSVDPRIDSLERSNAVLLFMNTHDNADAKEMKQVLDTDPLAKSITDPTAKLEYAYLKTQSMSSTKALAEAERAGAERVQQKTAEKQVAQVESAKSATPVNQKADRIERMRYGDKGARAEVISEIPAVKEMRRQAGLE